MFSSYVYIANLIGISLVFTEIIVNEYCTNVKVLMCDKRGRKLKVELEQHSRCFFFALLFCTCAR